jgi:UDP-glucose 4-epimerase
VNAAACELDPCFALEFNGNATGRLIRAAEKSEVKSFVYLSTAHVYANPLVGYIDENTAPSNSHPYATSHLAGELKVLERGSQSKSKMKRHVVRLSNVYGSPNTLLTDCWNLFINDIAKQIAMNKSILLRSDPSHERDFLAMGDFLNLMIGFTLEDKDNLLPSLINFGSGSAMSLIDVANKVSEIAVDVFGFRPPILNNPSKLVKEKTSFQYATKFKTISDRYRSNSMEKEIKQLLKFTKNNFGQDFYGG